MSYSKAFEFSPNRAEPLYYIERILTEFGELESARETRKIGKDIPFSKSDYKVQKWIYDYFGST